MSVFLDRTSLLKLNLTVIETNNLVVGEASQIIIVNNNSNIMYLHTEADITSRQGSWDVPVSYNCCTISTLYSLKSVYNGRETSY